MQMQVEMRPVMKTGKVVLSVHILFEVAPSWTLDVETTTGASVTARLSGAEFRRSICGDGRCTPIELHVAEYGVSSSCEKDCRPLSYEDAKVDSDGTMSSRGNATARMWARSCSGGMLPLFAALTPANEPSTRSAAPYQISPAALNKVLRVRHLSSLACATWALEQLQSSRQGGQNA